MKLKIISIEPNYDDLRAMGIAIKAYIPFTMEQIVKWEVSGHKDTGVKEDVPIEGTTYTKHVEGSAILQQVKEEAARVISRYQEVHKAYTLPGKEFDLFVPLDLRGTEHTL